MEKTSSAPNIRKWCKQNSDEIGFAPWQCLTNDMTLFDVVYLDIVHGFDVPDKVLLKYVDKGWSAEFVCRLVRCYIELDRGKFSNQDKYSNLSKSLLVMQHAFDRDYPTIETISNCICTLIIHKEFEIALRALESGEDELLKNDERICVDDLDCVVGHKTKSEFCEMTDLVERWNFDPKCYRISIRVFFLYCLHVCYKSLGHEEKLFRHIRRFRDVYMKHSIESYTDCLSLLLLLEVYEQYDMRPGGMFYVLYNAYMFVKMQTIAIVSDGNKIQWNFEGKEFIGPMYPYICSCSPKIGTLLQIYLDSLPSEPVQNLFNDNNSDNLEVRIARHSKRTADRMYYVQVLIFKKQIEKAILILNSIIDTEDEFSLSVFICPKSFWESNFLDDNLCKELSKSSADYVVFPTKLYARYLLVNAYNSLGQTEQCERNKTEFRILRQRYSLVEAFAPM